MHFFPFAFAFALVSSHTWYVANGLNGVGGSVDDGHHGGDDPEEDSPAHRRDRRDVQLIDEEGSLLVC